MKIVGWIIKKPNGKYVTLDTGSGGYPTECDSLRSSPMAEGPIFDEKKAREAAAFWNTQPSYGFTGLVVKPIYEDDE